MQRTTNNVPKDAQIKRQTSRRKTARLSMALVARQGRSTRSKGMHTATGRLTQKDATRRLTHAHAPQKALESRDSSGEQR
ncbi:hypothetical protein RhiirA1_485234 [Rhizophagus irregularis]|uniref:Uncharacterized protein n=1 Tax=Rhizophagus irregularis TaxID=588596 RepID=A0A2N0QIF6_9GLOM|nr:hypothetical protein RhiirA1_485234 [Rhizophagus irregularis]